MNYSLVFNNTISDYLNQHVILYKAALKVVFLFQSYNI